MKKSFYPILCNGDTRPTFHSRSTQMALCFLKCEIRSFILKRHQVDSVIKDFWPPYKLIKSCSIWWSSMKNLFTTFCLIKTNALFFTPDPHKWNFFMEFQKILHNLMSFYGGQKSFITESTWWRFSKKDLISHFKKQSAICVNLESKVGRVFSLHRMG